MPNLYAMLVIAVLSSSTTWWVQSQHYGKIIAEKDNAAMVSYTDAIRLKISKDQADRKLEFTLAELSELEKQKQKVITREIQRDVIKYKENPNIGKCVLDNEWVRIHDAAVTGTNNMPRPTDTTSGPNGASSANVHDK